MDATVERVKNILPDGVSITDYYEVLASVKTLILMVAAFLGIYFLSIFIGYLISYITDSMIPLFFGLVIGTFFGFTIWNTIEDNAPKTYQYELSVSEDANTDVLYENFNVISNGKFGNPWVIVEKTLEEETTTNKTRK